MKLFLLLPLLLCSFSLPAKASKVLGTCGPTFVKLDGGPIWWKITKTNSGNYKIYISYIGMGGSANGPWKLRERITADKEKAFEYYDYVCAED